MQHFHCLARSINVQPLCFALFQQPALWNQPSFRCTTPGSPHAQAEDVLLRCEPIDRPWADSRECLNLPTLTQLPEARHLIMALMGLVEGERLGRAMVTRLRPGHEITWHSDIGDDPRQYERIRYWSRYHIVLQSDPAVFFQCEDDVVHMAPGECWTFRNDLPHRVFWHGEGQEDRIHLLVDIHTRHEPVSDKNELIYHLPAGIMGDVLA
jgi:hypothetical protein